MRFLIFFVAMLLVTCSPVSQAWAATATVKDAGTIQLGNVTYRLDGIDAPAFDQLCIDEHADSWACGIEARDQLVKLIDGRQVRCDDLGPDPTFKKRRLGVCKIEGDTTSLSQLLVRQGFALNIDASATGRFKTDEARARDDRQGLWKGCFAAPQEFRRGLKDGTLLGAACRADRDRQIREALFPEDFVMPSGCNIKGKFAVRARVTGNFGIYHLQACRSYPGLTNPDRWFCSEEDAQAGGFRRAYNCRPPAKSK
ncbi:thermonuclease family protein [Bradyrhizobium sp. AUGA SZCCT0240]|jgi:endonuclease YncB( thermonuclease family)|uniref:thermonuclease family protein n=1 Tax=unclassified Bradyrhizobium TaxID=2631580 RepID=UPI001BAA8169|nr:thermonuclease family protein [Bradyrhizobium sp. AUGA SZCCT0158]MBR1241819.1 thermonuclease family protein [Bradyrhizobium sp. AUGA SZCCT0274]MBR1254539.1 thermonuclease family protein [Bradyrhizobium sp. AUGA SZCCT0240]